MTSIHTDTLRKLISGEIVDISDIPWDNEETVLLRGAHIERMLSRFLNNEVDIGYLEEWANLIESREDIIYEEKNQEIITEVLHHLANPDLQWAISKTIIEAYFKVLQ